MLTHFPMQSWCENCVETLRHRTAEKASRGKMRKSRHCQQTLGSTKANMCLARPGQMSEQTFFWYTETQTRSTALECPAQLQPSMFRLECNNSPMPCTITSWWFGGWQWSLSFTDRDMLLDRITERSPIHSQWKWTEQTISVGSDQVQTLKIGLEAQARAKLSTGDTVSPWCDTLTFFSRCMVGVDAMTACQRSCESTYYQVKCFLGEAGSKP